MEWLCVDREVKIFIRVRVVLFVFRLLNVDCMEKRGHWAISSVIIHTCIASTTIVCVFECVWLWEKQKEYFMLSVRKNQFLFFFLFLLIFMLCNVLCLKNIFFCAFFGYHPCDCYVRRFFFSWLTRKKRDKRCGIFFFFCFVFWSFCEHKKAPIVLISK